MHNVKGIGNEQTDDTRYRECIIGFQYFQQGTKF